MPVMPIRFSAIAIALIFAVSGCNCRSTQSGRSFGQIGVIAEDDTHNLVTSRDAVYDFGPVFMGQPKAGKITVQNLGRGGLLLDKLDKDSGSPVSISGGIDEANPSFTIEFEPHELGTTE